MPGKTFENLVHLNYWKDRKSLSFIIKRHTEVPG